MRVPSRIIAPRSRIIASTRSLCAAVAGAVLCACGFRLVGSEPLPPSMAHPYVSLKDPYTDFSREFEHQLKGAGAVLQPAREGATATIDVTRDQVAQRTLSVSAANIPTEYELTYTVTFSVQKAGVELLPAQTISLSKDYSFNQDLALAKQHEADILRQQMARDLVGIAMHRLTSLK